VDAVLVGTGLLHAIDDLSHLSCSRSDGIALRCNVLHRVADVETQQWLRSAATAALVVPNTVHSLVSDHSFPVAAARVWNNLPQRVTLSPSLHAVFLRRLKTELLLGNMT